MQDLLYLTHRIPYPPNKGDKIRSYHLLKHLSQHYQVHLGTFIDDPKDRKYIDKVKEFCATTCFINLHPLVARLRSLPALVSRRPLTLLYYQNKRLQQWVDALLKTRPVDNVLIFSSAMAQYVRQFPVLKRIIDFVDIDSDKWQQYANSKSWPVNWIYQRESRLLLRFEKQIANEFNRSCFVSKKEADHFKLLAPESEEKITYFNNGVNTTYFSPQEKYFNPYQDNVASLVFTGAMDYWANVDAVNWFTRKIFPVIHAQLPYIKFYIVGSNPTVTVKALKSIPGVVVTGAVDDIRPYLAHAHIVVAPLRIARGIQNKVLEAMSMEKVVIVSPQALEGINASHSQELFVAENDTDFSGQIIRLLQQEINTTVGQAARRRILSDYCWEKSLCKVDLLLSQEESRT